MLDKETYDFLEYYHSKVLNTEKRYAVFNRPRLFTDPKNASVVKDGYDIDDNDIATQVEYDQVLILEIPKRSLDHLVNLHTRVFSRSGNPPEYFLKALLEKEWAEHDLREKFPSVQQAYEHYSLMLHLATNGKEKLD